MTQVVLDLDVVEEEVLKKLLDMGLFETPQEALKIALLKYAMDLGNTKDTGDPIDPRNIPILNDFASESEHKEDTEEEPDDNSKE